MKISLATHGGQLAGYYLHRPPQIVNAESLPKDAAKELARLVEAAKGAPASGRTRPDVARDAMSYTITIENGDPPVILVQSDGTMSPEFVALRNWIKTHATSK
jgi:hypothetical protein